VTAETLEEQRTRIDAIAEGKTILDFLDRNADEYAQRAALVWKHGADWPSLTWSEYRAMVHRAAAGLLSLGLRPGDFTGIQAANRPEHVMADLATVTAGASAVTIYSTLQPEQIRYIAADCGVKVAFLENLEFMKRWEEIWPSLPNLSHVVLLEGAEDYAADDRVLSWSDLLQRGEELLASDRTALVGVRETITPESLATLIYTSGTTGVPKGVMITQRNVVWTVASTVETLGLAPFNRTVSYLPLAHIAERITTLYGGVYLASTAYFCPDMADLLEYIRQARPTVFVGVPRVYEKFHAALMAKFQEDSKKALIMRAVDNAIVRVETEQAGKTPSILVRAQDAIFERLVFSKVREGLGLADVETAITAAAPIDPALVTFFNAIGIPLYNLWGLSEDTGPATVNRAGANRIGSVGRPLTGVEVVIAEDGEIKVRGGIVTPGYYNLPDKTAAAFSPDGWLLTGDLGRIDEDGFVWITGRKKDIIVNAAGKNIAPAKLETAVKGHPLVGEACMIGDGRKYLTMLVALDADVAPAWAESHGLTFGGLAAFSELPEVRAEIDRVIDEANQHVSRVEQVKKFHIVPDSWGPETGEITPSLKLKRQVVLDKYSMEINALYAE
jgi:long-chain acyl-CoA synthetase